MALDPNDPRTATIQAAIGNLQDHNTRANAELNELLTNMHAQVQQPGSQPAGPPPAAASANMTYQQLMLRASAWTHDVTLAATLDTEFKNAVAEQAKQVLAKHEVQAAASETG